MGKGVARPRLSSRPAAVAAAPTVSLQSFWDTGTGPTIWRLTLDEPVPLPCIGRRPPALADHLDMAVWQMPRGLVVALRQAFNGGPLGKRIADLDTRPCEPARSRCGMGACMHRELSEALWSTRGGAVDHANYGSHRADTGSVTLRVNYEPAPLLASLPLVDALRLTYGLGSLCLSEDGACITHSVRAFCPMPLLEPPAPDADRRSHLAILLSSPTPLARGMTRSFAPANEVPLTVGSRQVTIGHAGNNINLWNIADRSCLVCERPSNLCRHRELAKLMRPFHKTRRLPRQIADR